MPSKSKIKGSNWERALAKYLSDTYNAPFMRNVSGSGAFIGGKNVTRKDSLSESQIRNSKGDVVPPDNWKINIEAKSYTDLPFHQFFTECPQMDKWIDQLMTVADKDDVNILFVKLNRKGSYVAVQAKTMYNWDTAANIFYYTNQSHGGWLVYSFDAFFKLNRELLYEYSTRLKLDSVQET